MALLSSFGKQGIKLGLLARRVDIEDTDAASKYFVVTEFNRVFTAGKNSVSFNGSTFLADKSEILVECVDSSGASLYLEQAKSSDAQFTDAAKFVVSIHIYDETYNGAAKLIVVGTTKKGETVRWIGNLTIDKTLHNNSKVRFHYKPTLEVRPLLYPVVDTNKAQVEYPPPAAVTTSIGTARIASYVRSVTINSTGDGYTQGTATVTFSGGDPSRSAKGEPIVSNGKIIGVTITDGGAGYKSKPSVLFGGGNTIGASGTAVLKSEVIGVTITNQGAGYKFIPKVTFISNPVGAGAQATAHVTGEKVTSVTIDIGGDGYTIAPIVRFEVPDAPIAPSINVAVNFSSSIVSYAGNPVKDTNKANFNPKQTDVDYRLTMVSSDFRTFTESDLESTTFPYKTFNTQMEGKLVTMHISKIQKPLSYEIVPVDITASIAIKKVLDAKTVQLTEPLYYSVGKTQYITTIAEARCFLSYQFILYNTSPDSSMNWSASAGGQKIPVKESHAEIVYRNVKCFSGYVARHKLYRKSSYFPGDFQLLSDEILSPLELLSDQVTFNKFYDQMGTFYNQAHINKYWFPNSADLNLYARSFPINSMEIHTNAYDIADGNKSVILKTDTIGDTNDEKYYPYDATEYARLSGSSYNSNFVNLKKDVLYVLSANVIINKYMEETEANVSFYFTSSIQAIKAEKTYDSKFGLKLGSITTKEKVPTKYFKDKQYLYFTPTSDYYGTLVIVPYHCNVTLSEVSLRAYGDYGFSPDAHVIRIPFKVNTANEAFDIKCELLDENSTVVYSNLKTVQTFDAAGESLLNGISTGGGNTLVTIAQTSEPYFPNLTNCDNTTRLVGWHVANDPPEAMDGKLCYTNISRLFIDSDDYIVLHEYQDGIEHIAKAIAVQYDYATNKGRKIFVDAAGTKTQWP